MHNKVISLMWFNEIKGGKNHHNLLLVKTQRTAHLYSIKVLYIVCLCAQICPKKHACHQSTAYCTRKTKKMCLCAIVYKDLNFIIYEHKKKDLESASIPFLSPQGSNDQISSLQMLLLLSCEVCLHLKYSSSICSTRRGPTTKSS